MALATRCPSCSTVFRISTAQAAAKGGTVRCGQCRTLFDALDALVRVEDLDVLEEREVEPAAVLPDAPVVAVEPAAPSPVEAAYDDEVDPRTEPPPAASDDEADADVPPEPAVVREWWQPDPIEPAVVEEPVGGDVPVDGVSADERPDAGVLLSGRRTDLQWPGGALDGTNPTFMRPEAPLAARGRGTRWVFGGLSLLALVALLGQAAYLWRDELAAHWSPARSFLTAACRPLQCVVDYPAHLDAISIESATIQASGPNLDVYVLTALLRNRESIDVRYPHLQLVLTDLQDRPILRRALRPEDYLPAGRRAGASGTASGGFAAESELPLRVTFELSDLRFAGYRLDRFYP